MITGPLKKKTVAFFSLQTSPCAPEISKAELQRWRSKKDFQHHLLCHAYYWESNRKTEPFFLQAWRRGPTPHQSGSPSPPGARPPSPLPPTSASTLPHSIPTPPPSHPHIPPPPLSSWLCRPPAHLKQIVFFWTFLEPVLLGDQLLAAQQSFRIADKDKRRWWDGVRCIDQVTTTKVAATTLDKHRQSWRNPTANWEHRTTWFRWKERCECKPEALQWQLRSIVRNNNFDEKMWIKDACMLYILKTGFCLQSSAVCNHFSFCFVPTFKFTVFHWLIHHDSPYCLVHIAVWLTFTFLNVLRPKQSQLFDRLQRAPGSRRRWTEQHMLA